MTDVKVSIIYYSQTGANYQMAQWAEEAAKAAGAETRLRKVKELAPESAIEKNEAWKKNYEATRDVLEAKLEDLDWADAYVFCVPTRYGAIPAQLKEFLDSTGPLWAKGKLANKMVTGTSSAMNAHGGQEATLHSLYIVMMHWGAIIVAPGYTDNSLYAAGGNPYGTSVSVGADGTMQQDVRPALTHQVTRLVEITKTYKKGLSA